MADGLLLASLENAFVSVLTAPVAGLANLYAGKASTNKTLPAVICFADGSSVEEEPPRSGNFWVDVEIQVKATAATEAGALTDPKVADTTLLRTVWDALKVDNLDALLNAAGQTVTVFPNGYFFSGPKCGEDELGAWTDIIPIKVYCCPAAVPA